MLLLVTHPMADRIPARDPDDETPEDRRWVYVLGVIVAGVVLLFLLVHLTGLAGAGMHGG